MKIDEMHGIIIPYLAATFALLAIVTALLACGQHAFAMCVFFATACLAPICGIMLIAHRIDEKRKARRNEEHNEQ